MSQPVDRFNGYAFVLGGGKDSEQTDITNAVQIPQASTQVDEVDDEALARQLYMQLNQRPKRTPKGKVSNLKDLDGSSDERDQSGYTSDDFDSSGMVRKRVKRVAKLRTTTMQEAPPTEASDVKNNSAYNIKNLKFADGKGFVLVEWDVPADYSGEKETWLPCIYLLYTCSTIQNKDELRETMKALSTTPVPSAPYALVFSDKNRKIDLCYYIPGEEVIIYRVAKSTKISKGAIKTCFATGIITVDKLRQDDATKTNVDEFIARRSELIKKADSDRAKLSKAMGLTVKHDDVTVPQLDADKILDDFLKKKDAAEILMGVDLLLGLMHPSTAP